MSKCPYCHVVLPQAAKVPREGALCACLNCLNPCLAKQEGIEVICTAIEGWRDARADAALSSLARRVLSQLADAVSNLPVLPEVAQRIVGMAHDPMTSMSDVARVINEDTVMAMKVLKLANSAFYANVQEIKNLDVACSRLGMKMVLKLAQAAAGNNLYRARNGATAGLMRQTWGHALVTALCAGEIGTAIPGMSGDDLFLAGLVHDVGRVALLNILGAQQTGASGRRLTEEILQDVADHYHALAGLHVMQCWGMSTDFRVMSLFHHAPESAPLDSCRQLTEAIGLADSMATALGYGVGTEVLPLDQACAKATSLGVTQEQAQAIMDGLRDQKDSLLEVLQV